jgi:hypothetical protein
MSPAEAGMMLVRFRVKKKVLRITGLLLMLPIST